MDLIPSMAETVERGFRHEVVPPSRAGSLLGWLDPWLRPETPWSLAREYPQVFSPGSRARLHALFRGETLLAHAASLDLRLRTPTQSLLVRLVGSVVVNPDHRARGLGRKLMRAVVEDFQRSPAEVCILWSELEDFYRPLGFERLGLEFLCELEPGELGSRGSSIREVREGDLPGLHSLHQAKPVRAERSLAEFEALLAVPASRTFVLEREGRIRAYASLGKGLDFQGVLHESAGEAGDLRELFLHAARGKDPVLFAMVPPHRRDLLQALAPFTRTLAVGPLGLGIAKRTLPEDFYLEGFDSI